MNNNPKKLFIIIIILVYAIHANGQTSDSVSAGNGLQFRMGINFNTNLNYFGRVDSLESSGFFPVGELWFGDNFYITVAPVFVNNSKKSFDYAGTITTAGYQYISEERFVNVYFLKPFYESGTGLVQSALKAQAGISHTWFNNLINFTAGADMKFSDETDFGATAGLDHSITTKPGGSILIIDPSIYVYAGTQQFTKTYYRQGSLLILPQQVTENFKKFKVLAYEISVPAIWAKGKFQFLFTPSYILPQNLIMVEDRPDLSERGKNMFYALLGVKLSL